MTDEQKARLSTKRPLTKEEYEARQSIIRRVVDHESGRTRSVENPPSFHIWRGDRCWPTDTFLGLFQNICKRTPACFGRAHVVAGVERHQRCRTGLLVS